MFNDLKINGELNKKYFPSNWCHHRKMQHFNCQP